MSTKIDNPLGAARRTWALVLFWLALLAFLCISSAGATVYEDYYEQRAALLENDQARSFCSDIVLTAEELAVDAYLKEQRDKPKTDTLSRQGTFLLAQPFYAVRDRIESSALFAFLRDMPKGGLLHVHSSALGRAEWIIDRAIAHPDCYIYWPENDDLEDRPPRGKLTFFYDQQPEPGYLQISKVPGDQLRFRDELLELITLGPEDLKSENIWEELEACFDRVGDFLDDASVFKSYMEDAFSVLIEDNIQYVEIRARPKALRGPGGSELEKEEFLDILQEAAVNASTPDNAFHAKIIICARRRYEPDEAEANIRAALQWQVDYPGFVIGFDLVGEEDRWRDTVEYAETLSKYFGEIPFYLHGGESSWASNTNVFDAFLFESRRIGHGFNLFHYQDLIDRIIEQNIALEICPLSNQILGYVPDLRIHPAAGYLKRGVQSTINSDDPCMFGYQGLTYDFWAAVVAWDLDLRAIKKLIENSFTYSGMATEERAVAKDVWKKRWNVFIRSAPAKYGFNVATPVKAETEGGVMADWVVPVAASFGGAFIVSLHIWIAAMLWFRRSMRDSEGEKGGSGAAHYDRAIRRDFSFFYKATLAIIAGVVLLICKTECPQLRKEATQLLIHVAGGLQLLSGLLFAFFVLTHQRAKIRRWTERYSFGAIFWWQQTWMFTAMISVSAALAIGVAPYLARLVR